MFGEYKKISLIFNTGNILCIDIIGIETVDWAGKFFSVNVVNSYGLGET